MSHLNQYFICNDLYQNALDDLKLKSQLRTLPMLSHRGQTVAVGQNSAQSPEQTLINIASNDYLAIGADNELQAEFYDSLYQLPHLPHSNKQPQQQRPRFGSTSSRLLTGNDENLQRLELELAHWYNQGLTQEASQSIIGQTTQQAFQQVTIKSALIINSGYHANIGILPAIAVLPNQIGKTLIIADKLVHASIIDGIQLACTNNQLGNKCSFKRYQHSDYAQLQNMVEQAGEDISRIIIVTESVFSMDGDLADLAALVVIKQLDSRVELYVDEAHSVGVFGATGLGLAEETATLADIDYLIGTFGKAFASMGAYIICDDVVRDWLINRMRTLVYSTALPPITHAWTRFVLAKMPSYSDKRQHLRHISEKVSHAIKLKTHIENSNRYIDQNASQSPIIPYLLGENQQAINAAQSLQKSGFYALAIRPPTVPKNTARIRLVMNAAINQDTCQQLIDAL